MGLSAPQPTTGGVHLIQHRALVLGFFGMVHGHPEQSEENNGAACLLWFGCQFENDETSYWPRRKVLISGRHSMTVWLWYYIRSGFYRNHYLPSHLAKHMWPNRSWKASTTCCHCSRLATDWYYQYSNGIHKCKTDGWWISLSFDAGLASVFLKEERSKSLLGKFGGRHPAPLGFLSCKQ